MGIFIKKIVFTVQNGLFLWKLITLKYESMIKHGKFSHLFKSH